MKTAEITIRVAPEAAQAYRAASEEQRRKLDAPPSLRLRDATRPGESLQDVMREVSEKAEQRGLTPEILRRNPRAAAHDRRTGPPAQFRPDRRDL